MLSGSLVELHAWLHSYVCFSLLEKWFLSNLDTSSIPPRHLAFCRALKVFSYRNLDRSSTTRWIDRESSWTLDSLLTAGGSIKLLFLCLCFIPWHLLDHCICRHCFSRHLPRQMAWHLYLSRITEDLYICSSQSGSHFLDLSALVHLPNTLSFTSSLFLKHFSRLIKLFFTW